MLECHGWFWEKCETLPMSFQLTIQLPPGQCWKVIQQTNTKPVCALLHQLHFIDPPLILCTTDSLYRCLPEWGFQSLVSPLSSCYQVWLIQFPPNVARFCSKFYKTWTIIGSCSWLLCRYIYYMSIALFLFHLSSLSWTAVLHTVRRRRRWRSTGMSLHLVLNTSLQCSTKPCKVISSISFRISLIFNRLPSFTVGDVFCCNLTCTFTLL